MLSFSGKGLFTNYVSGRRWGGGVCKMLTMADKGGRGVRQMITMDDKGGGNNFIVF